MIEVKENQELVIENVLSFRGKVTQQEMQEKLVDMTTIIHNQGAKPSGKFGYITYDVENDGRIDILIIMPINKSIKVYEQYCISKNVQIKNSFLTKVSFHNGNMDSVYMELKQYLKDKGVKDRPLLLHMRDEKGNIEIYTIDNKQKCSIW